LGKKLRGENVQNSFEEIIHLWTAHGQGRWWEENGEKKSTVKGNLFLQNFSRRLQEKRKREQTPPVSPTKRGRKPNWVLETDPNLTRRNGVGSREGSDDVWGATAERLEKWRGPKGG